MKVTKVFTLLIGSSLLLSAGAFAGKTNKKSLQLHDPVTIQGKQLKPGNYTVEWNGSGPNVEVNIVKGNKTVATVPARLVSVNQAYQEDGFSAWTEKDGSKSLTQLFFRGDKFDLELNQASGSNATPGANTSGTN